MHQLDLVWNDPAANLAAMERAWRASPPADLHVFPEMATTGFLTGAEELARVDADASGAPYLSLFQAWARESGAVFLTSLVVRLTPIDFRFANRLFAVFPDGTVQSADKMHLFGLAYHENLTSLERMDLTILANRIPSIWSNAFLKQ
jgi:predicted amidohydrolase